LNPSAKRRFFCPDREVTSDVSARRACVSASNPAAAAWLNLRSKLRVGDLEARIDFKPKKGNGHRDRHPWHVSLYAMRGDKVRGIFAPVARCFESEERARAAALKWIERRGAR